MSDIDITITKTGNAFHYSSNNSEVTTNGGNEGDIDLRNDSGGTKTITFARGSDQSWMFANPPISITDKSTSPPSAVTLGSTNEFNAVLATGDTSFTLTDTESDGHRYSYTILTTSGSADPRIYNKR